MFLKYMPKFDPFCRGFVIASSGNSMETGILGHKPDVKTSWDVWTLEDTARVELPLCDSDDTFPMGFAVDFSSQLPFLAGEFSQILVIFVVFLPLTMLENI